MRFESHRYQLFFSGYYGTVGQKSYREGALLKIFFKDGIVGYCDCHPWVELGDLPLSQQLSSLASGQITPLLHSSLRFARLDAEARKNSQSLFDDLQIPPSHQIVSVEDELTEYVREGISRFKLKTGKNKDGEIAAMSSWIEAHPTIKFRLDFNERLQRDSFLRYYEAIPIPVQEAIEFIEDPYFYSPKNWIRDQQDHQVSFAADKQSAQALIDQTTAPFVIYKPAVEYYETIPKTIQLIVTTYLDHPLGQMGAAYTAAKMKSKFPDQIKTCGLLSHVCYQKDPFLNEVKNKGPFLMPTTGIGLGFNDLLEVLPWKKMS